MIPVGLERMFAKAAEVGAGGLQVCRSEVVRAVSILSPIFMTIYPSSEPNDARRQLAGAVAGARHVAMSLLANGASNDASRLCGRSGERAIKAQARKISCNADICSLEIVNRTRILAKTLLISLFPCALGAGIECRSAKAASAQGARRLQAIRPDRSVIFASDASDHARDQS